MKKQSLVETIVLSAALIFIPLMTRAALDESQTTKGVVQAVNEAALTLSVPSVDGNQTNVIELQKQDETQLDGVVWGELKEGQSLEVKYHQVNGVNLMDMLQKAE